MMIPKKMTTTNTSAGERTAVGDEPREALLIVPSVSATTRATERVPRCARKSEVSSSSTEFRMVRMVATGPVYMCVRENRTLVSFRSDPNKAHRVVEPFGGGEHRAYR